MNSLVRVQGERSWQPFGEGDSGHNFYRQAHICYFRDKCVVFARNYKFASLIRYDMHYISCNSALLAQDNCFWTPIKFPRPKSSMHLASTVVFIVHRPTPTPIPMPSTGSKRKMKPAMLHFFILVASIDLSWMFWFSCAGGRHLSCSAELSGMLGLPKTTRVCSSTSLTQNLLMIIWMIVLSILFVSLKTRTSFSPMIDLERYINRLLIPELWQDFGLVFYCLLEEHWYLCMFIGSYEIALTAKLICLIVCS